MYDIVNLKDNTYSEHQHACGKNMLIDSEKLGNIANEGVLVDMNVILVFPTADKLATVQYDSQQREYNSKS